MKHPTTNLYILPNRILMMLYAVGPRTNEELAALLNNKPTSVRVANSLNIAAGLATLTQENKKEAIFTITKNGIDRVLKLPATKPGERAPPTRANPVKDRVLAAMRNGGLKATDFAKVRVTQRRLHTIVSELRKLGHPIKTKRNHRFVTYYIY